MSESQPARAARILLRGVEALVAVALILLMLHTVVNAFLRTFTSTSLTGTLEYVTYWYLPAVALLGFICAQKERSHVEAELIFNRLPRANQLEIQVAGQVLTVLLCVAFAYYGLVEAIENWHIGLIGGVTGVTIWPVTFLVPFAFGVMAVQVVLEVISVLKYRDPAGRPADDAQNPQSSGHATQHNPELVQPSAASKAQEVAT